MSVCFYYPTAKFSDFKGGNNIFKHSSLRNKHLSNLLLIAMKEERMGQRYEKKNSGASKLFTNVY